MISLWLLWKYTFMPKYANSYFFSFGLSSSLVRMPQYVKYIPIFLAIQYVSLSMIVLSI